MTDFKDTEAVYFVGIGGIGMSALALYFRKGGFCVAGYDRSKSSITNNLEAEGCSVLFDDDPALMPAVFRDPGKKQGIKVIFTPAIPSENRIMAYFRKNGYPIYKRSEILGEISRETDTIAISGTHGKTTVSTMTAHLLKRSSVDCSAFLGGISKNYKSNLLLGDSRYTVMEADEFDRSFHRLSPLMAVVTAVDADHLEIYGDRENMINAYNEFFAKIRKGGLLVINKSIQDKIIVPHGIRSFTYSITTDADYQATDIKLKDECFIFNLKTPDTTISDIKFPFPGKINIENLAAAMTLALNCGVTENELRKAILLFKGVKRRFDIRINEPGLTYIDDYAHHPEEIKACIKSVREYFNGRRITGIFQPHLFTRTRDHADGFAKILDELDEPVLLPIYPAREKPIEGVSSEMIYERMNSPLKKMLRKEDIPSKLNIKDIDVLLTIGAGDIDSLVEPIEESLKKGRLI
ncbi:MAG TPA: UDP-N-acetylmuramate--L-alanine ligase [Bacteroidales bacterium]|nr:UDP-N-acetylmuramate--L-alanine ligase [Bacteroidales bacterium]